MIALVFKLFHWSNHNLEKPHGQSKSLYCLKWIRLCDWLWKKQQLLNSNWTMACILATFKSTQGMAFWDWLMMWTEIQIQDERQATKIDGSQTRTKFLLQIGKKWPEPKQPHCSEPKNQFAPRIFLTFLILCIYKHSFHSLWMPRELQWEISTNCFHFNI